MRHLLSKKLQQTLGNDSGGFNIYVAGALILIFSVLLLFSVYTYSVLRVSSINISTTVKLEMNNLASAEAELLFEDITEQNFNTYVASMNAHKAELSNLFFQNLKKSLPMDTDHYAIKPGSMKLSFEVAGETVTYRFQYDVKLKFALFNQVHILELNDVTLTASHRFKTTEESSSQWDLQNEPGKKQERPVS